MRRCIVHVHADLPRAHIMSGFYDIAVREIDGTEDLLGRLRGKVTLAVNVASRCGLTPQYAGLEQLQRELREENFTVVGFPCNQFAAQEPGSEAQIAAFCRSNYDVSFPLSAKLEVNGPNRHPLYRFLTSEDRGIAGDISWNFEKFLIGRDGRVLKRYPPETKPQDSGVMLSIQNGPLKNELLAQAFGKERVLGALADTSGELLPDGAVLFTRNVSILVGELSGGDSARAQRLARTLETSGVRAAATPEILTLEWSKFCAWAGLMALSVTTRALTWKYLLDPDCALVLARLVREMGVLARTLGIGLSDRSILPIASLCAGSETQAVAAIMKAGREFRASAPGHRMSSLQDLEAGRPLEVNETLGYASAKARELGLTLPLLEGFALLIAGLDRARRDALAADAG